jgi:hypothetical protein
VHPARVPSESLPYQQLRTAELGTAGEQACWEHTGKFAIRHEAAGERLTQTKTNNTAPQADYLSLSCELLAVAVAAVAATDHHTRVVLNTSRMERAPGWNSRQVCSMLILSLTVLPSCVPGASRS